MNIQIDKRPFLFLIIVKYFRFFSLLVLTSIFLFFLRYTPSSISIEGYRIILIFILAGILWSTNLIPTAITGLLVIILIPLLSVLPAKKTYALFGNEPLFFILSAFLIAIATEKSGLSRRITLIALSKGIQSEKKLAFYIYMTGALLSFFMPEHAVSALMFPIVLEIAKTLNLEKKTSNLGKLLFLSLAYGTIIGGIATFLGGARNALAVGLLEEIGGLKISFFEWLIFSLPLVTILFTFGFIVLITLFTPEKVDLEGASLRIKRELEMMPPFTFTEILTSIIIFLTICSWILTGHRGLGLAGVSLISAILFFILGIVDWKEAERQINWSAFFMYGGAITLGSAFSQTDAGTFLLNKFPYIDSDIVKFGIFSGLLSLILTEFISNATVVALLLPIILKFGLSLNLDLKILTVSSALMSGLAFMLPIGTPPNLICYSSGYYKISDSIKAGLLMNLLALFSLYLCIKLIW